MVASFNSQIYFNICYFIFGPKSFVYQSVGITMAVVADPRVADNTCILEGYR